MRATVDGVLVGPEVVSRTVASETSGEVTIKHGRRLSGVFTVTVRGAGCGSVTFKATYLQREYAGVLAFEGYGARSSSLSRNVERVPSGSVSSAAEDALVSASLEAVAAFLEDHPQAWEAGDLRAAQHEAELARVMMLEAEESLRALRVKAGKIQGVVDAIAARLAQKGVFP